MTVCAVVLAAGEGVRLRPLTSRLPKPLCPVGNVSLLDQTLTRLAAAGLHGPQQVAVNACHLADQIVAAVGSRAHLSVEPPPPWGTSGGVARLRDWIDGRAVLACNADAYLAPGAQVPDLLAGWDGETVRMLVVRTEPGRPGEFGDQKQWRFAGMSLLPWHVVKQLPEDRGSLVHTAWRPAEARGALELVPFDGVYIDCGTPADYLAANLHAANLHAAKLHAADGGNLIADDAEVIGPVHQSVVGSGATVRGRLTRSVVLPGGVVDPDEHLVDAVRAGRDITLRANPAAR